MINKKLAFGLILALPQLALAASVTTQVSEESFSAPGRDAWYRSSVMLDGDKVGLFAKSGGTLAMERRFGSDASSAEGYLVYEVVKGFAVEGRLKAAGGADFLAKKGAALTIYAGLPAHLELTSTIGRSLYAQDAATVFSLQLDRQFGPWRIGAGRIADLSTGSRTNVGLINYAVAGGSVGMRVYKGAESQRSQSGFVTISHQRVAAFEATYDFSAKDRLLLALARTLSDASRTGMSLGFRHQF